MPIYSYCLLYNSLMIHIWRMERGEILEPSEKACVDMLSPETYWPQVIGQMVNCKSDLYPDWDWKCWGFSNTVSYALCVCFPSSTDFPDFIFCLDSISTHQVVTSQSPRLALGDAKLSLLLTMGNSVAALYLSMMLYNFLASLKFLID